MKLTCKSQMPFPALDFDNLFCEYITVFIHCFTSSTAAFGYQIERVRQTALYHNVGCLTLLLFEDPFIRFDNESLSSEVKL